jgi:hypothetical protein
MLVNIDGNDITKYILAESYDVNSKPVFTSWQDGNYTMHREIHRYKTIGVFSLKFPSDGGTAYEAFIKLLKENSDNDLLLITVFVNNINEYKTMPAYYEMYPVMKKDYNGKSYMKIDFRFEEQ